MRGSTRISLKNKNKNCYEHEIYSDIIQKLNNPFVLEHQLITIPYTYHRQRDIHILERHSITSLSFADIYGVIKYGDWTRLYEALDLVNWFNFNVANFNKIKTHTKQPTHVCCIDCRHFLAQLGLFLHKLHRRVHDFVHEASKYYRFTLTADNVDLNGILDFEDYHVLETPTINTREHTINAMAPFYQMLYQFYEHAGMYFITSPIYAEYPTVDNLLEKFETSVMDAINNTNGSAKHIVRPTIDVFSQYMHLDIYLGLTPQRIYDMHDDTILPELDPIFTEFGIDAAVTPCLPLHEYIDIKTEDLEDYAGSTIHATVKYTELINFQYFYKKCQYFDIAIQSVYVSESPQCNELHQKMLQIILQIWLHAIYDANVNLAHFDSLNYDTTNRATMPIIGEFDAKPIMECDDCTDIPDDIRLTYDVGTIVDATTNLLDLTISPKNPITDFDNALLELGTLHDDSKYTYEPKLNPPHCIDYELIDYMHEQHNITLKLAPAGINALYDNPDTTYTSGYYIKTPGRDSIMSDLELFNQNYSGSVPPTTLLMAYDMLKQILHNYVMQSNGLPNCPLVPDEVYVKNKHKSSGMPYRNVGDSELMRKLYGEFRNALVYHHRHSADQHLTVVINKIGLSMKHRDRTILAINSNQSEAGRSLYRSILEKIKYTSQRGGPILIGFVGQYGGWDRMLRQLYENFDTESPYTMLGGKDYPKWDRRISNLLQFVTSAAFFSLNDLYQHKHHNKSTPKELWHEYIAETTQIVFNYMVYDNKLYQKPGGVTSGNSRTADGNSLLHIIIDQIACIMQLVQSRDGDPNTQLHREIRDKMACLVMTKIPADYVHEMPLYSNPDILEYIRKNIMKGAYLSDDGLVLFDNRIIDYDDFMHESLLISTYAIHENKHKYHVDETDRYPREFLSQDTFQFGDKLFPLADFERILGATMLSSNKNTLDPFIAASRHLALYAIMYSHYYYRRDEPEHKHVLFLDKYREYLDHLTREYGDLEFSRFLEYDKTVDVSQLPATSAKAMDINEMCDILTGFNLSSAYPEYVERYQHRYKIKSENILEIIARQREQNSTDCINQANSAHLLCYVCGDCAILTCRSCKHSFCNSKIGISHFVQHILGTGHLQYLQHGKPLMCTSCPVTNICELYYSNLRYYCEIHRPKTSYLMINTCLCENRPLCDHTNTCTQFTTSKRDFYRECCNLYNRNHDKKIDYYRFNECIHNLLNTDMSIPDTGSFDKHITCTMQLCELGVTRPYYLLLNRLVLMESKELDESRVSISINEWSRIDDDIHVTVSSNHKLDAHSSYTFEDKNGHILEIRPEYVTNDYKTGKQYWKITGLKTPPANEIIQRRLNTLQNLLQASTKVMPSAIDNLLKWNSQLPEFNPELPAIGLNDPYFSPQIAISINRLLEKLKNKRFLNIFGAPGTGKSTLLANFLLLCLRFGKRVLIFAPSHQAVNSIMHKAVTVFRQNGVRHYGITRIVTSDEKSSACTLPGVIYAPSATKSRDENFIFTTIQAFSAIKHVSNFDYVLIDEFSLTPDHYLTSAISHLGSARLIFTGDPRQLSNVDKNRSDLNIRFSSIPNYYTETYPEEILVLDGHYRCHPAIFEFFKNLWYPDKSITCKVFAEQRTMPYAIPPLNRIPISGPDFQARGIKLNTDETTKVIDLVKHLQIIMRSDEDLRVFSIAIICCYVSQMNDFFAKQRDGSIPQNVHISTIDSVQGGEFDIVILCLSQTNAFTFDDNRMNVAISRAKRSIFITLPPKYNAPISSAIYDAINNIPEYNRHVISATVQNSKISNQSIHNPINLRDEYNKTLFYAPIPIMNPIHTDFVFFDMEFFNIKINKQVAVPLSYAAVMHHNVKSFKLTGHPVYYDKQLQATTKKFNRHDFVQWWNFGKKNPEMKKNFDEIAKQIGKTDIDCNVSYLINYMRENVDAKPTFVTYSGDSDMALLTPIFHKNDTAVCKSVRCASPAIYATLTKRNRDYYCAFHAQYVGNITHVVNIDHWDLKPHTRGDEPALIASFNGNAIAHMPLVNLENYKLETIHKSICNVNHGESHDPLCDAKMTRCVFTHMRINYLNKHILSKENIELFQQQGYALRQFSPTMCKIRRDIQKYWYEDIFDKNQTHCNQGCGRNKLDKALHNFDISQDPRNPQFDMNKHECEAKYNIYFDSSYYLSTNTNKPSYIFHDINPNHYCEIGNDLVIYLCSKLARYIHLPPTYQNGIDVFRTILGECSNSLTAHETQWMDMQSLPACAQGSATATNDKTMGVICTKHFQQLEMVSDISALTNFGYRFTLVLPEENPTLNESFESFDPTQLKIPGYETRDKQRGTAYMHGKMIGILQHLTYKQKFTDTALNQTDQIIFAGAASHIGTTPMGDILLKHLNQIKHNVHFVDPNLNDGPNCHKLTLAQFSKACKLQTQLLISDIYVPNDHLWFDEIDEHIKTHLTDGGSAIFKITCKSAPLLPRIDQLAKHFICSDVVRLEISKHTSELWIFLVDYQKSIGEKHQLKSINLPYCAKKLWYEIGQQKVIVGHPREISIKIK